MVTNAKGASPTAPLAATSTSSHTPSHRLSGKRSIQADRSIGSGDGDGDGDRDGGGGGGGNAGGGDDDTDGLEMSISAMFLNFFPFMFNVLH